MTNDSLIKKEIINTPEYYFAAQSKTIDERLKHIELKEEDKEKIIAEKTKDVIIDKTLGLFKIGELISTILDWNKDIDEDIREAKKELLLAVYFDKQEENERSIDILKKFLTSPQGNTLFNKILRILDDSPPDKELVEHLGNSLKYITNSQFESLFEDHKYALSQIEKLSPQALTILGDNKNWPIFHLSNFVANGSKITSDWLPQFVDSYANQRRITRREIIERINHSTNELIRNRYVEAHLVKEKTAICRIIGIGQILLPYINN